MIWGKGQTCWFFQNVNVLGKDFLSVRPDKDANMSLQSEKKILQLTLEPMSSQSHLVNLQVYYLPSVVRLSRLDNQLLPAGQCNSFLKLNSWNEVLLFSFYFFVVPKDLLCAQASQHGCISNRQVSTENYRNEDLETRWQWYLLTFFSKQNNRWKESFCS